MSRKVFLSILGTGVYDKTSYFFNDDYSSAIETRFIQEANIRYYCKDWTNNDIIIIFLTKDAKKKNWDHPANNGYDGLLEVINHLDLQANIRTVDLPDGRNEDELWQIFDIIYNEINEKDELYIDITHAFRSLPMILMVLINYIKVLKGAIVNSITYGNYEARDSLNYSPVLDLTNLSILHDWTLAANNFVSFGVTDSLINLTNSKINPILKTTQGKDQVASKMRSLMKNLQEFTSNLLTLRGIKIYEGQCVKNLKEDISDILKNNNLLPQFTPLLEKIYAKIETFKEEQDVQNLLVAAEWFIRHGFYQQAYSILLEGTITFICKQVGIQINTVDQRELVVFASKIFQNKLAKEEWNDSCKNNSETVSKIIRYFDEKPSIVNEILSLSESRNDFMHAGFRQNPTKNSSLVEKIKLSLENLKKQIN